MDWIFHNPLANMPGPWFLGLYVSLGLTLAIALRMWVRSYDHSKWKEPLEIPKQLDPYEVAYLRGGPWEVVRIAIVELFERKLLEREVTPASRSWFSPISNRWVACATHDDHLPLKPIHRSLLEHFRIPKDPASIFECDFQDSLSSSRESWDRWFEQQDLVNSSETLEKTQNAFLVTLAIMVSLGAYKFLAAIFSAHFNIVFLCLSAGVISLVLYRCSQLGRLTHRGKRYLQDLQTIHNGLNHFRTIEDKKDDTRRSESVGETPLALASVALFGVAALQGSSLNTIFENYRRSQHASSGCGSGASSGCSSSGCSSACGGGGGCGGGCGGCGGGGD